MKVTRRFLPMTTVTGPLRSFTVWRVNFLTRACHNSDNHTTNNNN
jgi:hypothetical protein